MRISSAVFVIFLCENPYKRDADTDSVASASKMHQQGLKIECVFLQCFLVLKTQNGESEIYFLININVRYFSLFKAGVTRVSVNFVWLPGGVSRSFIASIHLHFSIFFDTPVRTHALLNHEFFLFSKK